MSSLNLLLIGMVVFALLMTGLVLTAVEFIRHSDRPDLSKGVDPNNVRRVDQSLRSTNG